MIETDHYSAMTLWDEYIHNARFTDEQYTDMPVVEQEDLIEGSANLVEKLHRFGVTAEAAIRMAANEPEHVREQVMFDFAVLPLHENKMFYQYVEELNNSK